MKTPADFLSNVMGQKEGVATLDGQGKVAQPPVPSHIVNLIYPVGAIYMSANSSNPSTLFGGTWAVIQNRFLIASGDSYVVGSTGGSATHTHGNTGNATGNTGATTLTVAQMPSHRHGIAQHNLGGSMTRNLPTNPQDVKAVYNTNAADYVGGGEGHTHTLNNHTHTSSSANGMPPYLAVNMWQRTA